jgi:hypothetical protein
LITCSTRDAPDTLKQPRLPNIVPEQDAEPLSQIQFCSGSVFRDDSSTTAGGFEQDAEPG